MSLPATLDQIFSFEQNLETGFIAAMVQQGVSPTPQQSRVLTEFSSPFIALYFQNGGAKLESQRKITGLSPGRMLPFATYDGILSVVVQTNRGTSSQDHNLLLSQVRKSLQYFMVAYNWDLQQIDLPVECRETASAYEYDDELLIDKTTLNFEVLHSINIAAWPTTPIFVILPKLNNTTPANGQTITCDTGTQINVTDPHSFNYQWFANGVAIGPATNPSYTTSGDVGKVLTCQVTIMAANGNTVAASLATAPVTA